MIEKPACEELEKRIRELEAREADLKKKESEWCENESSFMQLFESAPVPMAYASEADGYAGSTWNTAWYENFGYPREIADGKSGHDIGLWVDPEDRTRLVSMANQQNYVTHFETRLRRHDGAIRNCSLFGRFIEQTRYRLLMIIYIDITEKTRVERELASLRSSLSNIIDSMPSVLVGVDDRIRVTQWNKTAAKETQISAGNAYGRPLADVFPKLSAQIDLIKESIQDRKMKQRLKLSRQLKGATYYEDITIYPLTDDGTRGAVIRLDDVTEKVRMEKMMIQNEKMLSLGGLAAGMAHEINNPLAGMIQTADVLSLRLGEHLDVPANQKAAKDAGTTLEAVQQFMKTRKIPSMITAIKKSGARVADIVENMLNFVRKTDAGFSSHDPSELLEKALELAATDYDLRKHYDFKHIRIEKNYEDPLPVISCHGARIQQVLLNVLRNGAQAMQENAIAPKGYQPRFQISLKKESPWLSIKIRDNGPGMDEKTCKRIFEPFFTTKPVGQGTGLGLSISYFIITEDHGGQMSVESVPGSGTTFVIRLPIDGRNPMQGI